MGKWNKAPPEVSEQFLQNQQRRKQMIMQAGKRRKQKQKKMQQQAQIQRKNQQDALIRHKQQKNDAYVKYLRNNMHDKYQEMKRNQKVNQPQIRTKSKWKKDTLQSNNELKNQNNLESLNLQVNIQNKRKSIQTRTYNKSGGQVVRNIIPQANIQKYQNQTTNKYQKLNSIIQTNSNNNEKQVQNEKRRMLENQFQDLWKQECQQQEIKEVEYDLSMQESIFNDLIASKLLDSLDLDFDTVSRGKKLDKKIKDQNKKLKIQKQENKEINEIKNMIGYQSVLMSIDQRSEMIKKYNQFMTNQIQSPNQPLQTKLNKTDNQKNSKNFIKPGKKIKDQSNQNPKLMNQGQIFNQLKNKKQGKLLNWANDQVQQADDLFSNCSTNKKSKTRGFQMLKQINKQIQCKNQKISQPTESNLSLQNQKIDMKKKQKNLQIIPEKKINASRQKFRQRSFDKKSGQNENKFKKVVENDKTGNFATNNKNKSHQIKRSLSKQKVIEISKTRPAKISSVQKIPNQQLPPRRNFQNNQKERANKTVMNSFKQPNISPTESNLTQPRNRTDSRRSLSRQKENNKSTKQIPLNTALGYNRNANTKKAIPIPPAKQTTGNKLSHFPGNYQKGPPNGDQITIATQDQVFEVASFIKNQLLVLNKQERQLQQELKNIHLQNKQKIKEVQKKYEIKTDYKFSHQLKQNDEDIDEEIESNSYKQMHKKQTEDELQESIQRLNDMLLRKQISQKQKNSRITEQDNQSQSTVRSIINPMSDPISLHKQVLQLAQNLSRFQGEPENIQTGYGAKLRIKKNASVQKAKDKSNKKIQPIQKKQTEIDLSQSQDVNYSQLNSNQKQSKVSKVSRPPQLDYMQNNYFMPPEHDASDLLQDELEDSIQNGKIQVNERLKRMLLQ